MHVCSDLPNRPPREVIDRLVDAVAWAKIRMVSAAATTPGSPEREHALEKLRRAVARPRRDVDAIFGQRQSVPRAVIVELLACELAIPTLEAGAILHRGRWEESP